MPRRCVVGGCSNEKDENMNISIHMFPSSDLKLRRIWEKNVQNTRTNWTATKWSNICSVHFTEDCFDSRPMCMSGMGIQMTRKRILTPNAVPTIFPKSKIYRDNHQDDAPVPTRSRKKVLSALLPSYVHEVSSDEQNESGVPLEELVYSHPTIVEREACETLLQLQTANPTEIGVGTKNIKKFNTSCQTTYNLIFRRHVKVQTEVATTEIGVQTDAIEFVREPVIISMMSECSDTDSASPDWTPVYESDDSVDEDECIEAVDFSKL